MAVKVLVVDDEQDIVKGLKFRLEQDGMEVSCAYDGAQALEMARKTEYDMVLLDVMLPKIDGLQVCQSIREFSNMPIIMLTAKGEDSDKILGLEYGADDYVTKPFKIMEVKARIKSILRRTSRSRVEPGVPVSAAPAAKKEKSTDISDGDLRLDTESRRLYVKNRCINVTNREFELLKLLVRNPNRVYSRDELLKLIWGYDLPEEDRSQEKHFDRRDRTVDVHIARLREKIEENSKKPKYIKTKRDVGYYYDNESTDEA